MKHLAMSLAAVLAVSLILGTCGPGPRGPGGPGGPGARAQGLSGGPPSARRHTATQRRELRLVAATQPPVAASNVSIRIEGSQRVIRSNSIAEHATGPFPNRGNPHGIRQQSILMSVPARPQKAARPTHFPLGTFGIAVNGVVFDPQAAEWYLGQRESGWQYDPLGAAVALGLDEHHAHVQPSGKYHYHGLPTGLMTDLGVREGQPSPVIGWAYDGFPIFALYDQDGREMQSGYRLKQGRRPSGGDQPGGTYDGTFLADWEWVGAGDLDECNGRMITTPEFPDGTYAYFLTRTYPVVPRCFSGTPDPGFRQRRRPRRG